MVFLASIILPFLCTILWPGGNNSFKGDLSQIELSSRIMVLVKEEVGESMLSMEEYLIGSLPTVISAEYDMECLKAQTVVLRTNLIKKYQKQLEAGLSYIEEDAEYYWNRSQLEKLWGNNYEEYYEKVKLAVTETKGLYLTYQGNPIDASYFRVSAGKTRNGYEVLGGEYPYLASVDCPRDYLAEEYLEQRNVTGKAAEEILGGKFDDLFWDSAGYCNDVVMIPENSEGEKAFYSGEWFRQKLFLSSASFFVEQENNEFLFRTKGVGHGLGMSQFGANEMAKEGKDYIVILSYFYQNIEIDKYE